MPQLLFLMSYLCTDTSFPHKYFCAESVCKTRGMWETFAFLILIYPKNQVEIFFLIMQTCPAEVLYSLQVKEKNILSLWIYSVRVKFILLKGKNAKRGEVS